MTSRTTQAFRKAFKALPPDIQDRARKSFEQFQIDSSHPSLRFKKVHPAEPIYSARISLSHRALAVRTDEAWIWFWIGSHSDYDQLLEQL